MQVARNNAAVIPAMLSFFICPPRSAIVHQTGKRDQMRELMPVAEKIGAALKARKQTVAVAESAAGGLISAALLAVPGASAYFIGGGVYYTRQSILTLRDT